jgi:hypothetical protein
MCKNQYGSFKKSILACFDERINELANTYCLTEEYKRLSGELYTLFKNIVIQLPEDSKDLIERYAEIYSDMLTDEEAYFYRQGFLDCLTLVGSLSHGDGI